MKQVADFLNRQCSADMSTITGTVNLLHHGQWIGNDALFPYEPVAEGVHRDHVFAMLGGGVSPLQFAPPSNFTYDCPVPAAFGCEIFTCLTTPFAFPSRSHLMLNAVPYAVIALKNA
jgi:hypothetical protein